MSLTARIPIALLRAVKTAPDIFRTVGNVTADMAAARIVDQAAVRASDAPSVS